MMTSFDQSRAAPMASKSYATMTQSVSINLNGLVVSYWRDQRHRIRILY